MPLPQQIQRRLRHANMRFDPHDHYLMRTRDSAGRGEVPGYGRDPHREGGFVDVFDGGEGVEGEFGAGFAQAGFVLRGGVDGDVEDFTCAGESEKVDDCGMCRRMEWGWRVSLCVCVCVCVLSKELAAYWL